MTQKYCCCNVVVGKSIFLTIALSASIRSHKYPIVRRQQNADTPFFGLHTNLQEACMSPNMGRYNQSRAFSPAISFTDAFSTALLQSVSICCSYSVVSWKGKGPKDTFEQSTSYSKLWQCHSDTIDLNHPAARLLLNRCQHQCPQPYTALFCCQFLRLSSVTLYWQTTICYECGAGLFAYSNKILLPCYVLDC